MRFVKDARRAWRWFSVQVAAVLAVMPLAWGYMPADIKGWVPDEWKPWIIAAMGAAVIVGRLVDQGGDDA